MALRLSSKRVFSSFGDLNKVLINGTRAMSDKMGSGSGKGGGSGGSIREAGGKMGEMGAAREDEYFRKKQKEQLDKISSHLHDEISRHENLIKQHAKAIEDAKKTIDELKK